MPYLSDLINGHKINEWKIQIYICMYISSLLMIQEKLVLFLCGVIMKKLGWVMKPMILLKSLLE